MDQRFNFENKMAFKVQSTLNDSFLVSNRKVTLEDHNKRCNCANFYVTAVCLQQVFFTGHGGREHCCH